jgi:hypothetical protein
MHLTPGESRVSRNLPAIYGATPAVVAPVASGRGGCALSAVSAHVRQGCSAGNMSNAGEQAGLVYPVSDRCSNDVVQDQHCDDEHGDFHRCNPEGRPRQLHLESRDVHKSPSLKKSNLDASGTRVVRKGSVVEFRGGARGTVTKVRLGHFWHGGCHTRCSYEQCADVRVVA